MSGLVSVSVLFFWAKKPDWTGLSSTTHRPNRLRCPKWPSLSLLPPKCEAIFEPLTAQARSLDVLVFFCMSHRISIPRNFWHYKFRITGIHKIRQCPKYSPRDSPKCQSKMRTKWVQNAYENLKLQAKCKNIEWPQSGATTTWSKISPIDDLTSSERVQAPLQLALLKG